MSTRLPTELQCLALRMRNTAQELAQAAAQLPDLFTDWQPGQAAPTGVNLAASEMLAQARTLEFDAQRLKRAVFGFEVNDANGERHHQMHTRTTTLQQQSGSLFGTRHQWPTAPV